MLLFGCLLACLFVYLIVVVVGAVVAGVVVVGVVVVVVIADVVVAAFVAAGVVTIVDSNNVAICNRYHNQHTISITLTT